MSRMKDQASHINQETRIFPSKYGDVKLVLEEDRSGNKVSKAIALLGAIRRINPELLPQEKS
ncbi:hypothetical protein PGT21_023637 [Puccinia graminis f. sp. tritici]|uniref:Uncharacterized protein n=1 Tax=Puccinia graminis f. sp. tritici TaxID=56615 RepID=A0A5B0M446_PUCGR|nr:hypothetical protein PGTUg99_019738 [Puccinia graminis f. sp. tritici]KAA1071947.1 hypothetical protein PGT21_023637 [Puccinia graminis f. sp. tritici]